MQALRNPEDRNEDRNVATPAIVLAQPGAPVRPPSALKRWLQEPMLHFLFLGVMLFGAYGILHPESEAGDETLRIELTNDDLRQLAVMWLAQGRPAPTPAEMRSLVAQKVDEEILAREAVALGLDRDDQIIKRRLAQKMDFLVADLATLQPPTPAELQAWFAANAERFAQPPHLSFRHLYFSFDKHGNGTRDAAAAALDKVAGIAPDSPELASVADPFMFRNYYGDATPEQMAKELGPDFAAALFQFRPGSWQGPIQSGYGWHLIRVDSFETGRVPALQEVEPTVKAAWLDNRYLEIKRRALDEMRSRYTVIVPPLDKLNLQIPQGLSPDPVAQ